ncbi:hypothetical protein AGMMS50229_07890 [Campylobacterota bacterium]|nr:hypothetical protein AGMMS50229_07890 [Campylobacterota bacterium]
MKKKLLFGLITISISCLAVVLFLEIVLRAIGGSGGGELNVRTYSFGFSGAPLSQYLVYAQNYRKNYLIVAVVGNDFDESLLTYKNNRGFHYYADTGYGLELQRIDYLLHYPFAMALPVKKYSYSKELHFEHSIQVNKQHHV